MPLLEILKLLSLFTLKYINIVQETKIGSKMNPELFLTKQLNNNI